MKFAIGIPTLNRYDLLKPSLMLYLQRDFPTIDIFIMDNGKQGIVNDFPKVKFLEHPFIPNEVCDSVACSWNVLCKAIFEKHENALILNDDIYLGSNTAQIEAIMNKKKNKGSLILPTPDWCAFIISKKIYENIGNFDEQFTPAYYEDKDYEYRMKLAGISIIRTPELNPFVYNSSKTLEKNPLILEESKKNKQRYINKWGGEPNQEKYKTPYGK